MTEENNRVPLSGYHRVGITQSTLFPQVSGEEQIVGIQSNLPNDIAQQLQRGDVYAFISCPGERNAEAVFAVKGSYSSTSRTLKIRRGASKFALGDITNATSDFTVPKNLYLDFGYANPMDLKFLTDAVNDFFGSGADGQFFNERLPKGTNNLAGTVKVAYRREGIADNTPSQVIPVDAPAWEQLGKAVFGQGSIATSTLRVDTATTERVKNLEQFLNMFSSPQKVDALDNLLTLFANPAHRKKLNDFIKNTDKDKK